MAKYKVNQQVEATVERILSFGVFVRLPNGSSGYIRRRELALDADVEPNEIVQEGEKIKAVVIKTEEADARIELSRRATLKDPWIEFVKHNFEGTIVRGRVRALHSNGVFVRVQAGITGFVPLAEIATWLVDKPEDVLWIGDMVEAIITEIDSASQRLTLSIRTLMLERDAIKASLPPSGQPVVQSSLSVSPKISSPIPTDIRDKVGTILIVDDHDEVRSSLTEWLKHRGFTAMSTNSLEKAIDLFEKNDYQVLLADLNLMEKDGMDLVRHLRKNGNETHICIMSSMDELNERAEEIEAAQVLQVFPKPLDVEEIEAFFWRLAGGGSISAWRAAQKASSSLRMVDVAQGDHIPNRKRIQSTLDEITHLIRAEISFIFQLDPASQTITIMAQSGKVPLHLEALYSLNASPIEDVIRDGGVVFETHVSEKARAKFAKLLELLPFESCMGVPIHSSDEDEIEYAVFFFHRETDAFSRYRLRDAQAASLLLASVLARETLEKQIQLLNPMLLSGELARGFGHDVFNKITALDLEARLLIGQKSRDEIQTSAQHLFDLILDLKATVWAFQQLLQTKETNERFDVNQAVKNAITLLLPVAQKERAKIEVNLAPDLPQVFGNPIILQQVVLNLMLNAVQQMSLKAEKFRWVGRRTMRVTTSKNKKENKIRLRIADNGPGIHQAHLKKIFSHGFSTRGGSGLGLNIAQGFIQSLGGVLRVQETLIPLGTTFVAEVPFDTQEPDK